MDYYLPDVTPSRLSMNAASILAGSLPRPVHSPSSTTSSPPATPTSSSSSAKLAFSASHISPAMAAYYNPYTGCPMTGMTSPSFTIDNILAPRPYPAMPPRHAPYLPLAPHPHFPLLHPEYHLGEFLSSNKFHFKIFHINAIFKWIKAIINYNFNENLQHIKLYNNVKINKKIVSIFFVCSFLVPFMLFHRCLRDFSLFSTKITN